MSPTKQAKGNAAIVVIIASFIVLFIILIIVGVMVANQKGWFKKEKEEETIPMIELYLRANELDNLGTFFDSNVVVSWKQDEQEVTISSNNLVGGGTYSPFLVPADRIISVKCWNDEHYLVNAYKSHNSRELQANKSSMDCTSPKIGHLEIVKQSGDLTNNYNIISLNVTARDGWWYRLGICFKWSAGIIDVTSQNQWLQCDSGKWLNFSKYNATNKSYEWLPEGEYRCGDEWIEQCVEVKINRCRVKDMEIPRRFEGLVDRCTYTGKTLSINESYIMTLEVPTLPNKNSLDYLELTFYDHDRRYDQSVSDYRWTNQDVGAEDQIFIIPYTKEEAIS